MLETPGSDLPPWTAHTSGSVGDASRFSVAVGSISLASGSAIDLPSPGVTAVVGANNCGKSTLLRQVRALLHSPQATEWEEVRLIEGIEPRWSGGLADLFAWLSTHTLVRETTVRGRSTNFRRGGDEGISDNDIARIWESRESRHLDQLASLLVKYADAYGRLSGLGTQQRSDVSEPPEHPLHYLQDDARLVERLSGLSTRILREALTLDDLSMNIKLRIGRPSVAAPKRNESQGPYRRAMGHLRTLESQGDGMKSLVGLLSPLVAATYPIIVVDEPEAFLHPPQAFALGKALGEIAHESKVQIILATHDKDLLSGLLATQSALAVVRLNRDGDTTTATHLSANRLREVWSDPVLRYSNVLDGLFYRLVVLAEAEQDCRFYSAALDTTVEERATDEIATAPLGMASSDVLFVPSNGKAGMAKLAEVLSTVAVPIVATPDLDILNDDAVLARLVSALGGDWASFEREYRSATANFRAPRGGVKLHHVRDAVLRVIDEELKISPHKEYDATIKEKIATELRAGTSPWEALKQSGVSAFKGQARPVALRLLDSLERIGIVAVRVGELECFANTVDLTIALGVEKGREWLPAALEAGLHKHLEPQKHIQRVLAAAGVSN